MPDIHFEYIQNLWWLLALLPIVASWWLYERWKRNTRQKMGDSRLVNQMLQGYSPKRNLLKNGMALLAVLLLIAALLNLQKPVQEGDTGLNGLDVMIALDVSNSMLAQDESPSRLEKARLLTAKLIDTLQGNRVGIIAFAGDAYLQLPLTTDIAAARLYLQSISTALVPKQGTNIYDALKLANISMNPAEKKYKAVILVTDGEEMDEKAMDEAKDLASSGIVLLTVGIGSAMGATLTDENGLKRTDENGQVVVSRLNEKLLQQLVIPTHGTYRHLANTDETVTAIVAELSTFDKKPIINTNLINYKSYSSWMIVLAFLLLLLQLLLPDRVNKKTASGFASKLKPALAIWCILLLPQAGMAQNSKLITRKANEAYRQQQYDKAEKLYAEALKTDPGNAVAKYNLGNIAYRRKQYDNAIKNYDDATASSSAAKQQAGAFNNKGLSHVAENKLPEAIEAFKKSIRRNPYDEQARKNLNKALKEQQKQQQEQKNQQNPQDSSQQKQDKQKKEAQPEPQPENKIKKDDAEDKLQALRQEEKKLRDKMNKQKGQAGQAGSKDW